MNDRMFMAAKLTLLAPDGKPAAGSIVTLQNQQLIADEQGVAIFADVMHNTYPVKVVYDGQHFNLPAHFHAEQISAKLGMSLEIQRLGAFVSAALLIMLTGGAVAYFRIRKQQQAAKVTLRKNWKYWLRPRPVALLMLVVIIEGLVIAPLAFDNQTVSVEAAATGVNLPVPVSVKVEPDDRNAIVTWNGGPLRPDQEEPEGVTGFKVSWGISGQPLTNSKLVTARIAQIQPLNNGQVYVVQVQAVDSLGRLSSSSAPIAFTPTSARVDTLRAKMNGFFDDFNLPAGVFDERKWNTAYSRCNDPAYNGTFINSQFHAHNMYSNGDVGCDREQVVNRPRQIFDFTNRVGNITFDFDGSFERDSWYLDLVPEVMDMTGRVDEDSASHPGNFIRIRQSNQGVSILYVNNNGIPTTLADTDWEPFPPLDWVGLNLISNVRRHWSIQFSKNYCGIFVNGQKVLETSKFNLNYTRAVPLWVAFGYNTTKAGVNYSLLHWDNFGFDAPAGYRPTTVTHNYRLNNSSTDFAQESRVVKTLNIPDSLAGAKAARLMFTMQMDGFSSYDWNSSDAVTINGQRFAIPEPKSSTGVPSNELVAGLKPYSATLTVPANTFKTGANTLDFALESAGIHNIHAEFDFDIAGAPAFTQPDKAALGPSIPMAPDVGPNSVFTSIGSRKINWDDNIAALSVGVSGKVPLGIDIDNYVGVLGTGNNYGILRVEVLVDGKVFTTLNTATEVPAPRVTTTIDLDTTQLTNGAHKIYVRAFNGNGTVGRAGYPEASLEPDKAYPITINVSNSGVPQPTTTTAKPTTTVAATTTVKPTTTAPTTTPPVSTTVKPTTTALPTSTTPPPTTTVVPVPQQGNGTGLKGEYFSGVRFNTLKLTRTDPGVGFNWNNTAPDTALPQDNFSVRWTGQILPQFSETYTFYTYSDDGVRLWVNGQQIINNWTDHAPTENRGQIALTAGQKYDIKIEFYERGGGAVMQLSWSSPRVAKAIIPKSQLFPAGNSTTTPTTTANPTTTTPAPTTTAKPTTTVAPTTTIAPKPPAGLKNTFMVGLGNQPGEIDWMIDSGIPWDMRYQYLVGDVTTGENWTSWNQPTGAFATYYMNDSAANNFMPVFTYYMMYNSSPGRNQSSEAQRSLVNLKTPSTMKAYFANFKLLMDKAKAFGKTVIVHVEPDFWGYVQQASSGDNPASVPASVNSSGYGDVAVGKSDNVAGFAQTLVALRDKYASNVLLAFHVSGWSTSLDVGSNTDPNLDVTTVINRTNKFINGLGTKFNLLFFDVSDRDAGYYAQIDNPYWKHWWDMTNQTFPNFERFRSYLGGITKGTGTKAMLWQVPIGNKIFRTMNNTPNHWQDNRVEYFLGPNYRANLQSWISAGLIGIMFGAGAGDQTSYGDIGDGITNPAPINGNNQVSTVSDDDGGYLRERARNYYQSSPIPLN
jgi:hypothetical protein